MEMDNLFGKESLLLQDEFDTRRLAGRIVDNFVRDVLNEEQASFVAAARMVFLATCNADGNPECTYKGGRSGFITVLDEKTLQIPFYNGNGLFSTLGNIAATGRVGLFFIDFETSYRLRVNGPAVVSDPPGEGVPGALKIVTVTTEVVYDLCERYVHRMQFIEESPYSPADGYQPPSAPYLKKSLYDGARPEEPIDKS
jgi:predicted pyridoxine 5'-phosphate oxidase superfamily flavin-nucleotide-binding protein